MDCPLNIVNTLVYFDKPLIMTYTVYFYTVYFCSILLYTSIEVLTCSKILCKRHLLHLPISSIYAFHMVCPASLLCCSIIK